MVAGWGLGVYRVKQSNGLHQQRGLGKICVGELLKKNAGSNIRRRFFHVTTYSFKASRGVHPSSRVTAVRIREYCIHILVSKQPVILPSENDPSTSAESGCVTSARLDSPQDADLYVVGARITVVVFVIRPDKFGESTLRRHNIY